MRVLVTGSRKYTNYDAIAAALMVLPPNSLVIHGAADGADALANKYVFTLQDGSMAVMPFPAHWVTEGKGAGPKRNTRMLDEGEPEIVFAFVNDPTSSPGTANMVLQALARGLPMWLFDREGNLTVINPQVTTISAHTRSARVRAFLEGGERA